MTGLIGFYYKLIYYKQRLNWLYLDDGLDYTEIDISNRIFHDSDFEIDIKETYHMAYNIIFVKLLEVRELQ